MVCPGPICMYERKLLLELGGFKNRTIVEDFDMTLEITERGRKAVYVPEAVSWTSTPKTFKALRNQRVRWYRGNLQAFGVYRHMLFSLKHGSLGMFWLPYTILFGFGTAIAEVVLILATFGLSFYYASMEITVFGMALYLIFEILSIFINIYVLTIERRFTLRHVMAAMTMKPYHLFLTYTRLVALWRTFKGERATWNG